MNATFRYCKPLVLVILFIHIGFVSPFAFASDSLLTTVTAQMEKNTQSLIGAVGTQVASKAATTTSTLESQIIATYVNTEQYCALQMSALTAQKAQDDKKNAHVSAWGGLIALIGGVTVYAPAKAVMMGIGISSSGGSGSVLGGMASSLSSDATRATGEISSLKANYIAAVSLYNSITDDPTGVKRLSALTQVRAVCDGLATITAPPSGK
jgi:hypothetical protein